MHHYYVPHKRNLMQFAQDAAPRIRTAYPFSLSEQSIKTGTGEESALHKVPSTALFMSPVDNRRAERSTKALNSHAPGFLMLQRTVSATSLQHASPAGSLRYKPLHPPFTHTVLRQRFMNLGKKHRQTLMQHNVRYYNVCSGQISNFHRTESTSTHLH